LGGGNVFQRFDAPESRAYFFRRGNDRGRQREPALTFPCFRPPAPLRKPGPCLLLGLRGGRRAGGHGGRRGGRAGGCGGRSCAAGQRRNGDGGETCDDEFFHKYDFCLIVALYEHVITPSVGHTAMG